MTERLLNFISDMQNVIDLADQTQRCGARTRSGEPCRAPGNGRGGRCRRHGGASTGPRTEDGKKRARLAVIRRWESGR